MRNFQERNINPLPTGENPDYLRGYRDGMRDRSALSRPQSGDGILGALLAIALLAGVGYFGYHYVTTGRLLPNGVEINPQQSQPINPSR